MRRRPQCAAISYIGDASERFKAFVEPRSHPFVVGLLHQCSDQAFHRLAVRKDADHVRPQLYRFELFVLATWAH